MFNISDNLLALLILIIMFGFSLILFLLSSPVSWFIIFAAGFVLGFLAASFRNKRKNSEEKKKL